MELYGLKTVGFSSWHLQILEILIWVICMALVLIRIKMWSAGGKCHLKTNIKGRVVVITGAAQGIGLQTMLHLLKDGCKVIFGNMDREASAKTVEMLESMKYQAHFLYLDLSNRQSIRTFAEDVVKIYGKVDVLLNNAGTMTMKKRTLTPEGIQKQLAVNYVGHFYLASLLLPTLVKSDRPRIINVSSMAYNNVLMTTRGVDLDQTNMSWERQDIKYDDNLAYSRSKLAILLSTVEMADRLKDRYPHLRVVCLHPGMVRTALACRHNMSTGYYYLPYLMVYPIYYMVSKNPREGAQTSLYCVYEETDKLESGCYYGDCKKKQIKSPSNTKEMRKFLWDWTLKSLDIKI